MEWTMNWLDRQVKEWRKRALKSEEEGLRGHTGYAEKQQVMWLMMLEQAKKEFRTRMVL